MVKRKLKLEDNPNFIPAKEIWFTVNGKVYIYDLEMWRKQEEWMEKKRKEAGWSL